MTSTNPRRGVNQSGEPRQRGEMYSRPPGVPELLLRAIRSARLLSVAFAMVAGAAGAQNPTGCCTHECAGGNHTIIYPGVEESCTFIICAAVCQPDSCGTYTFRSCQPGFTAIGCGGVFPHCVAADPTPSPTPGATQAATSSPTCSATATDTATAAPSESPTADATQTATATTTATTSPAPAETPTATATATASATQTPTATGTATTTATAIETAAATPSPTRTVPAAPSPVPQGGSCDTASECVGGTTCAGQRCVMCVQPMAPAPSSSHTALVGGVLALLAVAYATMSGLGASTTARRRARRRRSGRSG